MRWRTFCGATPRNTARFSFGSIEATGVRAAWRAPAHAGHHNSPEAKGAAEWILKQKFEPYNTVAPFNNDRDHYHFGVFGCCQGMYQMGGRYWAEFYPQIVPILLANQQADGSWPADSQRWDAPYGPAYSTALNVMTLGAPNQLMPIFQR